MILANAATQATAIDPTVQILLTIFGAALVTALAGFVGASLQNRREHQRWIRQERLAAYLVFLKFAHSLWDIMDDADRLRSRIAELKVRLQAVKEERAGLAPGRAYDAATERLDSLDAEVGQVQERHAEILKRMDVNKASLVESCVACFLLGPKRVASAGSALANSARRSPKEFSWHLDEMEHVMRRALDVGR